MAEHAADLDALAAAHGVTRRYHDGTGRWREACDEAVLAVLRALGAPVQRHGDVADALRQHHDTRPATPISSVATGEPGLVRLPPGSGPRMIVRTECGADLEVAVVAAREGMTELPLPPDLPAGRHEVRDPASGELVAEVLAAPRQLPPPSRAWAIFAPLYGLRHAPPRGAAGMATYADLAALGRWAAAHHDAGPGRGQALVATLPLLDLFLGDPFEPSPYSPVSRACWSPLYVDPSSTPEAALLPVDAGLADAPAPQQPRIDYRGAFRARSEVLEAQRLAAQAAGGARLQQFEEDLARDPVLGRYAAFRASMDRHARPWPAWPDEARGGKLVAGRDYDPERARHHAWLQWIAREQLAAAADASPSGLYLDLPLSSHPDGFDPWHHRGEFAEGVSLGAPPDAVFEGGQDWGLPPLHPVRSSRRHDGALRTALAHHCRHATLLRIDHVMGLHRTFWIPTGFTAADGVYVAHPAEQSWSLVAIEAARGRGGRGTAIVGEDLGTVPPEVREEMARRGALRMHVVPFELQDDPQAACRAPVPASITSLGTHDMQPFAAWWQGADTPREALSRFLACGPTAEEALAAWMRWLGRSEAAVALGNLEDFWLETRRQNMPGTPSGETNWQRPLARSFEEWVGDPAMDRLLHLLRGAADDGGQA